MSVTDEIEMDVGHETESPWWRNWAWWAKYWPLAVVGTILVVWLSLSAMEHFFWECGDCLDPLRLEPPCAECLYPDRPYSPRCDDTWNPRKPYNLGCEM